jgi:AraC-like DNA-binding protein
MSYNNLILMLKDILLLNPVYVTLFWAVVLNFYSNDKHAPKVFLGKFMLVAFVIYLSHLLYFSGQIVIYRYLDSIYTWASLLVFPLYHIYVRLLTVERRFSLASHGKFLTPPTLLFLLHLSGVILLTQDQYIEYLLKVIPREQSAKGMQIFLLTIYQLYRVVFILQVFFYLYKNSLLIRSHNENLQDYYSNTEDRKLHWVQLFNILLGVTSLMSIIAAFLGRETFTSGAIPLALPSVIFSLMLFFIGLAGNTQKALYIAEKNIEEESDTTRLDKNITQLRKKLDNLFEKEKIFKNPDLKIWDVSHMLGTNRTYVSRLINEEYKKNFCNHVNQYRVEYAMELARQNPELTNEQIADLTGFGSQNSMHRAFQTAIGTTLKQYRGQIITQYPQPTIPPKTPAATKPVL